MYLGKGIQPHAPGHDTRWDHYPRTRQILVGLNVNF